MLPLNSSSSHSPLKKYVYLYVFWMFVKSCWCVLRGRSYLAYVMLNGLLASICFLNYLVHSHSVNIIIYWHVQNLHCAMMCPSNMTIEYPIAGKTALCKLSGARNWNNPYPSVRLRPPNSILIDTDSLPIAGPDDFTPTWIQTQVLFSTSVAALAYPLIFSRPDGASVPFWSPTSNRTSS